MYQNLTKRYALLGLAHLAVYAGFWAVYADVCGLEHIVFGALLIWISCADFEIFEVPDTASFLLMLFGVLAAYGNGMELHAFGAVLWFGLFLLVALCARHILGEDGLGLGDVKLMGGIGMWLGPLAPLYVVLCASLGAVLTILVTQRGGDDQNSRKVIAFGPFICLSAWVVWLGEAAL